MMRRAAILLLLSLLLQPAPPPFSATWAGPGQARISWQQPAGVHQTCLYRNATLIRCALDAPAGPSVVTLGSAGPLDGAYRPKPHDIYTLTMDGTVTRTGLAWALWMPLAEKPPIVGDRRLWLGMVRGA